MTQELTAADRDRFFSLSLDMLCISSGDGYFKWLNPAFSETLGWSLDELLTRPYRDFVHPDDWFATVQEVGKQMIAGAKVFQFENRYRHRDGSWRVLSWMSVPEGDLMYAVARDVTARNLMEHALLERVQNLAQRDPVTGLANRTYLRERLETVLRSDPEARVAVLWIELGKFQETINVHGEPVGDALLRAVAARLLASLGEHKIIGRNEGDKFLVVQVGNVQPTEMAELASSIIYALRPQYEIQGLLISADPKVGIAVSPADGKDLDQLLGNAHLALLRAMSDDLAPYQFFAPEIDREAKTRRALEADLSNALRNNELSVYYQPLVNLVTQSIVGCEALLRWNHPRHGSVPPVQFISIAETSGLISSIGAWVLRKACSDASAWPSHLSVAVNLSAIQFRGNGLIPTVLESLKESGLQPSRLELEITESVLLADNQRTLDTLRTLKAAGVRISMDDFGTGYSSLGYLQRFPFDKIKIDRSFVQDLDANDPTTRVILRAVSRVGSSLGIATLAEGIETGEQLEIVRQEGCIEGQGYLFGRPQPVAQFVELIRTSALTAPRAGGSVDTQTALAQRRAVSAKPSSDEEARLRALYALEILDSPSEESFDRITRLARAALNAPMAMISLVDRDRQWFKSRSGVTSDENPIEFSFCNYTIAQHGPFVVNDAMLDARFNNSPVVIAGQKVRAYAGVPLRTSGGFNIGALCINDVVPRMVTPQQIEILQDLAQLAVDEMELRRIAQTDPVTGVMTARRLHEIGETRVAKAREDGKPLSLALIDIDNFRQFNSEEGHAAADLMLALVAGVCCDHADHSTLVARLGGDRFAVLLQESSLPTAERWVQNCLIAIKLKSVGTPRGITASAGVVSLRAHDAGLKILIQRAEAALLAAKVAGGNQARSTWHAPDLRTLEAN